MSPSRSRTTALVRTSLVGAILWTALVPAHAAAAPPDRTVRDGPNAGHRRVERSIAEPEPWALTGRTDRIRSFAPSRGLDGERAAFRSVASTPMFGPLSLRVEAGDAGAGSRFSPEVSLGWALPTRRRHDRSVTLFTGYETQGLNLTPAVVSRLVLSRTVDRTRVSGQLAYAQAMGSDERYGDVRWTVLRTLARSWMLGMDARVRLDLERDADEPVGEQDWEAFAGPLALRPIGPVILGASAGVFATKLRLAGPTMLGAEATLTLGTPF